MLPYISVINMISTLVQTDIYIYIYIYIYMKRKHCGYTQLNSPQSCWWEISQNKKLDLPNRRASIKRSSDSLPNDQQTTKQKKTLNLHKCSWFSATTWDKIKYWVTCYSSEENIRRGKWHSWICIESYREKYSWIDHKNLVNVIFFC